MRIVPALLLSLALCLPTTVNSSIAATTASTSPTVAKLYVDGKQFEFIGAFIPGWYWGQRQTDQTDIALLESAKEAGFTALRVMPPIIDAQFGVYKETEFKKLDFFLDQASKQGIRVIIEFIHNIAMTQPGYGPFYSPYGIETLIKNQEFKNAFVLHMQAMANRVNFINGLKYSRDPTILGWEIIGEPFSPAFNYPVRPPNVTHYEVRQWLDEMAKELKAVDPNHLVGINLTAGGDGAPEFTDKNLSILETPSLDFIEIEDADVRVLQTERSNHIYDLAFRTGKPIIMHISFTGLSNPEAVCNNYLWQANTLFSEFSAYRSKGAAGFVFFSWRLPGTQPPDFDKCFSYSLDTPFVVQSFQQMNAYLGPLNVPGLGFTTIGYGISTLPVYRFFNNNAGGHFYSIDEAEKNTVINNYNWFRYEGIGFYASPVAQPGMLPVYRFFNNNAGGHFYTISEAEKNTVIQNYNWFRYEGIGFYASPSP